MVAERRALQHAEPVLLVDDHESEPAERDVALNERVSADDEVNRAGCDLGQLLASGGRRRRARQKRDAKPRIAEQARDVQEVLLREDFGRRHEGDLEAVLHLDKRRKERDDRFSRADVALEQPVHRMRPLHVVDDFLECLFLPVRQLERQHVPRGVADPIVDLDRHRLLLRRRKTAPREHAHLKKKCFLENEPPLRRCGGTDSTRRAPCPRAGNAPRATRPPGLETHSARGSIPGADPEGPVAAAATHRRPAGVGSSA